MNGFRIDSQSLDIEFSWKECRSRNSATRLLAPQTDIARDIRFAYYPARCSLSRCAVFQLFAQRLPRRQNQMALVQTRFLFAMECEP